MTIIAIGLALLVFIIGYVLGKVNAEPYPPYLPLDLPKYKCNYCGIYYHNWYEVDLCQNKHYLNNARVFNYYPQKYDEYVMERMLKGDVEKWTKDEVKKILGK